MRLPSRWAHPAMLALLIACRAVAADGAESAAATSQHRLQAPLKLAVAGQSLRGALDALRQASDQPYWLERRVDPDQMVAVPLAGPTVAAAFEQVAASADLVILPTGGLVLVGRASWIDRVGALMMQSGGEGQEVLPASAPAIRWPKLTTPDEALRIVAQPLGLSVADVTLPHDLWPAVDLPPHTRRTVLTLIGAEFDLWITADSQRQRLQVRPLPESTAAARRYPTTLLTATVRQEVARIDPQVQWKPVDATAVQVQTTARAHSFLARQATAPASAAGRRSRSTSPPQRRGDQRFTLRLENAPADRVLATLAAAGDWTLQVDPQAAERCARLVTLVAEDAPLDDLVKQVVQQLGLQADVRGSVLHVRLP